MKLFVDPIQKIKVGSQTVVYTERNVKPQESVTFFPSIGKKKPIAKGVVVNACKDEKNAPITPTKTGRPPANAWRNLYRVEVTEILEKI